MRKHGCCRFSRTVIRRSESSRAFGFVARSGEGLIDRLVAEAAEMCLGHSVVRL